MPALRALVGLVLLVFVHADGVGDEVGDMETTSGDAPLSPSDPAFWISSNVSVNLWQPATSTCLTTSFDPDVVTVPASDCCFGGMFQAADLPMDSPAIIFAWVIILCYIFVPGVAMSADVFMTSIEVITSKEYTVKRESPNGTVSTHHVRLWNVSVANLTLMALGSSAPEILLSVIEILANEFYAGELGPSTIVGSAAFNLMIITGICIVAIPTGEVRSIKTLGVFITTSVYSLWAYLWLYIMVLVWTPNVITITEGLLTVLFLFMLIIQAYVIDKHGASMSRVIDAARQQSRGTSNNSKAAAQRYLAEEAKAGRSGQISPEGIAEAIRGEVEEPRRTRAHYLRQATGEFFGNVVQPSGRRTDVESSKSDSRRAEHSRRAGEAPSAQMLRGGSGGRSTGEETTAGASGRGLAGGMLFSRNAAYSVAGGQVVVEVTPGASVMPAANGRSFSGVELGAFTTEEIAMAQVATGQQITSRERPTSVGAPPAGLVRWREERAYVAESEGVFTVAVERVGGASGAVSVGYRTKNQSAIAGKDFVGAEGTLRWADGDDITKEIEITILDDDELEKDEEFTVVLHDLVGGAIFDYKTDGGAEETIMTVVITNDDERAAAYRKALQLLNIDYDNLDLAAADYLEQIRGAFSYEGPLSCRALLSTALVFPWKLALAVMVPPPGLCGGVPCFVMALFVIALQVVLISDFASQMGCLMGLKDSVTAITFVAFGTSLPDAFASVQAARGDRTADNSIGNVTGSNSVNVFFGLGVPWLMAAIYWSSAGANDISVLNAWRRKYADIPGLLEAYPNGAFVVRGGDLGFSVIVFTTCACATIGLLLFRRWGISPPQELGGYRPIAKGSCAFLIFLWFLYVMLSTMKAYGTI